MSFLICSICHQDVMSESCWHLPGREYESILTGGKTEVAKTFVRCFHCKKVEDLLPVQSLGSIRWTVGSCPTIDEVNHPFCSSDCLRAYQQKLLQKDRQKIMRDLKFDDSSVSKPQPEVVFNRITTSKGAHFERDHQFCEQCGDCTECFAGEPCHFGGTH